VTTIRRALEAVARGEPAALRMAVDALGETLDVLTDHDVDMTKLREVTGVASDRGGRP
jgi:hypothetical protein